MNASVYMFFLKSHVKTIGTKQISYMFHIKNKNNSFL